MCVGVLCVGCGGDRQSMRGGDVAGDQGEGGRTRRVSDRGGARWSLVVARLIGERVSCFVIRWACWSDGVKVGSCADVGVLIRLGGVGSASCQWASP